MRNRNGVSLIELLLVVAVILIISAIAVPNFLRSRERANEASAVASIRVINTAAVTYSMTYADLGYPAQLPYVATSAQTCLLDDDLGQVVRGGYTFVWTGDGALPSVGFVVTDTPRSSAHRVSACSAPIRPASFTRILPAPAVPRQALRSNKPRPLPLIARGAAPRALSHSSPLVTLYLASAWTSISLVLHSPESTHDRQSFA
jgi:type IV pilus assembly protein PilA